MEITVLNILFDQLMETSHSEIIFSAARDVMNHLLEEYVEKFRSSNILVTFQLEKEADYNTDEFSGLFANYLHKLHKELERPFTIMIFPFKMLGENLKKWLEVIDHMLAYQGKILLYHCPEKMTLFNKLELIGDFVGNGDNAIKILQTRKGFDPTNLNLTIMKQITLPRKLSGKSGNDTFV